MNIFMEFFFSMKHKKDYLLNQRLRKMIYRILRLNNNYIIFSKQNKCFSKYN